MHPDQADVTRRTFLKMAGGAAVVGPRKILAIFEDGSMIVQDHLVPVDKNLPDWWKRSLFERGVKEVWSGADLESIGMPCGGIATGQMYLCGDGTLGNWEIFNSHEFLSYGATNYAKRAIKKSVEHGFSLLVDGREWRLNKEGFPGVTFNGQYPMAHVTYADDSCPVKTVLTAFSPFIPLNAKDSALPATMFEFCVENTTEEVVQVQFSGFLENAIARSWEKAPGNRRRRTKGVTEDSLTMFSHSADLAPVEFGPDVQDPRSTIVLADFEGDTYGEWVATGDSFGTGPAGGTLPNQNRVSGFLGRKLVNTFLSGDGTTGTLTSPEFVIERRYINFLIGGGNHPGEECINLLVGGKVVRTATGLNDERLLWETWDVSEFAGKRAVVQIVDKAKGGWGHINIDQIELGDTVRNREHINVRRGDPNREVGTLALAIFEKGSVGGTGEYAFSPVRTGTLASERISLRPGESKTFSAVLAWHFPNHSRGRQYANWFADAEAVVRYIAVHHKRLVEDTKAWVDTLYDSTLPYWLLDRLHSTVSYLATGTTEWWGNGRFWAWEGVVCCSGTCTHVWNYEHSMARLFPELERNVRERQDFGEGFHENGLVGFRSDSNYAADGQCGTILKAYREHTMSRDSEFLKRNWPSIKKAMQFSMSHDPNGDGVIEDSQHNTYDINFEGPNTFVGALYLGALRAAEEMAKEVGDAEFAAVCRRTFERGSEVSSERLWNGEYFIQEVDAEKHPQYQYGPGCLADQMFGQGWAHHVGLGYLYPEDKVKSALRSVWRYCWAPDIAPQNSKYKPERPFAVPGEAGMFICTWPKGSRPGEPVRYRDEVWTGIEYQVAGHMVWEGMVEEGLAVCRAIHDRYHPAKRNPYNEVECSDHYARAMASWGVFTALSGFSYHGPSGKLSFAPRMTPTKFKSAFVVAEGYGTYSQEYGPDGQSCTIAMKRGSLKLRELSVTLVEGTKPRSIAVTVPGTTISGSFRHENHVLTVTFERDVVLDQGFSLIVQLGK